MSDIRCALRFAIIVAACASVASAAAAQLPDANSPQDAYSRGVAAYAAGQRDQAATLLAEAIRLDPQDPRPYYLRALCLARTGHPVEARADLVVAAALESRDPERYGVDDSLATLSVPDRTLLNQFRWRAHSEDFGRAFDEGLIPAGVYPLAEVRSDAAALRQKVSVPLGQLSRTNSLADLVNSAVTQRAALAVEKGSDPFSDDPAAAATASTSANDEPIAATDQDATTAAAAGPELQDPFAGTDPEPAPSAGKVPASKLFGIVRRALTRAAPLPSVDGLRDQLPPGLPIPGAASQPPAGADPFDASVEPAAFGVEADSSETQGSAEQPAADPTSDFGAQPQPPAETESQPAADLEEDPFG